MYVLIIFVSLVEGQLVERVKLSEFCSIINKKKTSYFQLQPFSYRLRLRGARVGGTALKPNCIRVQSLQFFGSIELRSKFLACLTLAMGGPTLLWHLDLQNRALRSDNRYEQAYTRAKN